MERKRAGVRTGLAMMMAFFPVMAETVTFQNGQNGYNGCKDAELREQNGNYNEKVAPGNTVMLVINN